MPNVNSIGDITKKGGGELKVSLPRERTVTSSSSLKRNAWRQKEAIRPRQRESFAEVREEKHKVHLLLTARAYPELGDGS